MLIEKFERNLRDSRLLRRGERVYVACSGGPDSVCLLHLFLEICKSWKLKLGVLHFHHGLRGKDADRDLAFVRSLAKKHKLPFVSKKDKVKKRAKKDRLSLEEAAREARYEFFLEAAKKYRIKRIALGQHEEDQAETLIMRILKGTGLKGLQGIRPNLKMGQTYFIRPLLNVSKFEMDHYLKLHGLKFRKDKTNDSTELLRGRVRHRLLPGLKRNFNPGVVQALSRLGEIVRDEYALLEEIEEKAWKKAVQSTKSHRLEFRRSVFLKLPSSLQFRLLDRALKSLDRRSGMNHQAWALLRGQLGRSRHQHSLKRDIDLSLTPSKLSLYKKRAKSS